MIVATDSAPIQRKPKHINLAVRARATATGAMVQGSDGKWHRYLNCYVPRDRVVDDLFCLTCTHGYSTLHGADECPECRQDRMVEHMRNVENECGVVLMARTPDYAAIRAMNKFRDTPLRGLWRWGASRVTDLT